MYIDEQYVISEQEDGIVSDDIVLDKSIQYDILQYILQYILEDIVSDRFVLDGWWRCNDRILPKPEHIGIFM